MIETIVVYGCRFLIAFIVIVVLLAFILAVGFESSRGRKKAKPMKRIQFDYKQSRHVISDSRDTMASWRKSWRV